MKLNTRVRPGPGARRRDLRVVARAAGGAPRGQERGPPRRGAAKGGKRPRGARVGERLPRRERGRGAGRIRVTSRVAHPEWLSVPQELGAELFPSPPRAHVPRRARDYGPPSTRTRSRACSATPRSPNTARTSSPSSPISARATGSTGIHLDYIRYPSAKWGYSRAALDLFRAEVDRDLSAADRADMTRAPRRRSVRLHEALSGPVQRLPPRGRQQARAGRRAGLPAAKRAC